MFLIPMAIKIAKAKTGRPVPIPYIEGRMMLEPFFNDRGIKLPKNNAAETGQKESANSIPKGKEPTTPRFLNLPVILSGVDNPKTLSGNISRRKNPVMMRTGPTILFM